MLKRCTLFGILGLGIALSFPVVLHAATPAPVVDVITGAGSTFVYPVMSKWAVAYDDAHRIKVNYQSIGSGAGLAQIRASAVEFGASDVPLKSQELDASNLGQFPVVVGGVVPVMNLPGIAPGTLKFSGALLADIFMGKVDQWNDPAIVALNPGVRLPAAKIIVVYRSDNSGTTYNWASYLSRVSPAWKAQIGEGTALKWPTGLGAKGSEGVASYVRQMPNSIGYIEYAYVKQNKLGFGLVQNKSGKFVAPSVSSFQAAAAAVDWASAAHFDLMLVDAHGEDAWPITAATFIVLPRHRQDAPRRKAVHDFFKWALEDGKAQATSLDYAPLPEPLIKQIEAYWSGNGMTP